MEVSKNLGWVQFTSVCLKISQKSTVCPVMAQTRLSSGSKKHGISQSDSVTHSMSQSHGGNQNALTGFPRFYRGSLKTALAFAAQYSDIGNRKRNGKQDNGRKINSANRDGQRCDSTAQKSLSSERKTAQIAAHGFNIRLSASWVQIRCLPLVLDSLAFLLFALGNTRFFCG